jgi:citrate synthase
MSLASAEDCLDAKEAAELLGIKLRTLYAYVSRGQVRSVPGQQGRTRLYLRKDIERLRRRKSARRGEGLAADALRWGAPVLDSAITEVTPKAHFYRGQSAIQLAEQGTAFEAVAELLWSGALPVETDWIRTDMGLPLGRAKALAPKGEPPLTWLACLVPALAAKDPGRFDRSPRAVLPRARVLIWRMAVAQTLWSNPSRLKQATAAKSVAAALAVAFKARGGAKAVRAIDQALVLWADHELNVSSFAARVAASAHADLYSCVAAGLAALSGPRHGAACDQIEALVQEAGRPSQAATVVHARTRRGESIPGFGHPLYPDGDPRARVLLKTAKQLNGKSARLKTTLALVDAMRSANGLEPTVDTGLVALAAALNLAPGLAPGIVAVGRAAGWVAHVLEQYDAGFLIRPRARYSGE